MTVDITKDKKIQAEQILKEMKLDTIFQIRNVTNYKKST